MVAVTETKLAEYLPLVATGKVREIYRLDASTLLFVATDRISAFDVVLANAIDEKGAILTSLSEFWFRLLQERLPALRTHFISSGVPSNLRERLPTSLLAQVQPRSMVVRSLRVLPIESIVRGYITGSAWASYQRDGTVCGIHLPAGLQESQKFAEPLWTPSTKAEAGSSDENISPEEAARIIGPDFAKQVEQISLEIYGEAHRYASDHGIIIADTKFEFGLDESVTPAKVVLIDEVLTPDSSRFWPAAKYQVGRGQESLDKQTLREWLIRSSSKGKQGVGIPPEIVEDTFQRYSHAYNALTESTWTM